MSTLCARAPAVIGSGYPSSTDLYLSLSPSDQLQLPRVLQHLLAHDAQLLARAELDELRAGRDLGRMARRDVERVAGLEDLVAIAVVIGDLAVQHVAPVRAVAPVVRQALQERRAVDVDAERQKVDRVAVDVLVAVFDRPVILDLRCALLRYLRHLRLLCSTIASVRTDMLPRMRRIPHPLR